MQNSVVNLNNHPYGSRLLKLLDLFEKESVFAGLF